ncbi:MAG: hypothetical protein R2828_05030 [Saprospiraceae bacterium]
MGLELAWYLLGLLLLSAPDLRLPDLHIIKALLEILIEANGLGLIPTRSLRYQKKM